MSLVFVAVERCVFSLPFCQFLIQNFLKTIEIVVHSLIQRIFKCKNRSGNMSKIGPENDLSIV